MNKSGRSLRDGLSPSVEPASSLDGFATSIPSAIKRELNWRKSLAADHFRNSVRLAARLVAAEDEVRRLKRERSQ